jgi:hypothetical protein
MPPRPCLTAAPPPFSVGIDVRRDLTCTEVGAEDRTFVRDPYPWLMGGARQAPSDGICRVPDPSATLLNLYMDGDVTNRPPPETVKPGWR